MKPETEPKSKVCFVIMPIADMAGYDPSHFSRVYEYIFKPAIEAAGLKPIRADEVRKTNYIVIDILRKLLDSDIVLCDISGRNPNVLFELGIGQAFNRPICIVKDTITEKVFDIQGLRYTEFDISLRIDTVRKAVADIAQSLRETLSPAEGDVNSLVELLSIKPASLPSRKALGEETSILLAAINDLGAKVARMEKDRSVYIHDSGRSARVKRLKDLLEFRIGTELWVNDGGFEALKVVGIQSDHIVVQDEKGKVRPISYSSDEFSKLSDTPF